MFIIADWGGLSRGGLTEGSARPIIKRRKGATGRRLAQRFMLQEVTALFGRRGGYFLFLACRNKPQMPMMTKQSCNTSDVLTGTPSFRLEGARSPLRDEGANRPPLLAALKDHFLSYYQNTTGSDRKQEPRTSRGKSDRFVKSDRAAFFMGPGQRSTTWPGARK